MAPFDLTNTDEVFGTHTETTLPVGKDPANFWEGREANAARDAIHKLREHTRGHVNVRSHGASTSKTASQNRIAIQEAIDAVGAAGGGAVLVDELYSVEPSGAGLGALWVPHNNVAIVATRPGAGFRVHSNEIVPVHVCATNDLTNANPASVVEGFRAVGLTIRGTGIYENFALAYGRGLLLRRVRNALTQGCTVRDMSMIGIAVESGEGYIQILGNNVGDCKYTAINVNGRGYQSVIADNVCFGSNASADSVAIQACGHSIVKGNTVFGSIAGYANCGGIMWGEGDYTGMGVIEGNLVKHCRYGVLAWYHGPVSITANTLINNRTQGGIVLVGTTIGGFTVGNKRNVVASNLLINNYPAQIECSSPDTLISGNQMTRLSGADLKNPSAGTEPDAVVDVTPEYDLSITADGVDVIGNSGRGAALGAIVKQGIALGVWSANDFRPAGPLVAIESSAVPGARAAYLPVFERRSAGGTEMQTRFFGSAKPTQGFWPLGTRWERAPSIVGQPLGEDVIMVLETTVPGGAANGAATITVADATGATAASGNSIGVELPSGAYHWTSVTNVAGSVLTLAAVLPAAVSAGARVYHAQWHPLATL